MPTTKLENQAKFNIKLLKQKNAQQVLKEGFFGACKTILDRKAMRWFLLTILPFVVLTIISSQIRSTSSTETIYVPQNFCELDKREECVEGKCIRYDPRKFRNSPSVMTYFPGGRMGNMITAYLTLLWMKLEFNYDVYLEKQSYLFMNLIFKNINETTKVLEDGLCDWRQFGFQKYEGSIDFLGAPEWKTGKAIEIFIAKENFMRHEIQGGRKFYKKYKKEAYHALEFKPEFQRFAELNLQNVAKKTGKNPSKLTFVGIHNRRTDYLEFRRKRLGLDNLYEDYFEDAMEYFREEYGEDEVVFVYVSDDMKWGRRRLKEQKNLFFLGCGNGQSVECIAKDFALLANCNHTITTHGTYSHWASYLAGGEIYTEYGTIIPDAHV